MWSSEPEESKKEHIIPFSVSFKIKTLDYKDVFLNSSTPCSEKVAFSVGGTGGSNQGSLQSRSQVPVADVRQKMGVCRLQSTQRKGDTEMNRMNSWGELDKVKGIEVEDSNHVKKVNF